jgi:hypothetical protein
VLAQEPDEVRRRGVRRVELGHRWGDEQELHGQRASLPRPDLPRHRQTRTSTSGYPAADDEPDEAIDEAPMTRSLMTRLVLATAVAAAIAGCHDAPTDDGVCRCTPDNRSRTRLPGGGFLDGATLLGKLRRHRSDVALQRPARDVKMFDDELRLELTGFCQPCSDWVKDRLTIEDMFPLDRLDDAAAGVCMGLVLRDGTTVFGSARPRACR